MNSSNLISYLIGLSGMWLALGSNNSVWTIIGGVVLIFGLGFSVSFDEYIKKLKEKINE